MAMVSFTASAQTRPSERVKKQRVVKNFRNGNLTGAEVVHMKRDRANLKKAKRHAMSDGTVTPAERRILAKMKRHERRQFVALKNNNQKRG